MGSKRLSFITRYVLLFGALLLAANIAMGVMVFTQSQTAMRNLIDKNMLDVVKSAAGSLDGDKLGALTEDDVDGPVFHEIGNRLLVFKYNTDIHFIYAVKQDDEGKYVFTVDPDPVDPGEFGEEVLVTPALVAAAKGTPTVDKDPAADEWGNFYSAYCPVYDSSGSIAGVVGVDFDAQWYEEQLNRYTVSIACLTIGSVLIGSVAVVLMTNRVRKRFKELDEGLSELSHDVDVLIGEMKGSDGFEAANARDEEEQNENETDELEALDRRIRLMQTEMGAYLTYLRKQAYIDSLTGVESAASYHELTSSLEKKIEEGAANFWVAVFDLNSLKQINDTFGHEIGDQYIQASAQAIMSGFADARVFRVGGDEFAVVAEGYDQERVNEGLARMEGTVLAFNEGERPCAQPLALSRGATCFDAEKDTSYKEVFARADQIMYENKQEYYRTVGDRRRRE
ncbi:MAG: diguanylate cyclase [Atopobiaceae bacterium]|nr:diguanylate cyclase [Atopobiaceae bacterium]